MDLVESVPDFFLPNSFFPPMAFRANCTRLQWLRMKTRRGEKKNNFVKILSDYPKSQCAKRSAHRIRFSVCKRQSIAATRTFTSIDREKVNFFCSKFQCEKRWAHRIHSRFFQTVLKFLCNFQSRKIAMDSNFEYQFSLFFFQSLQRFSNFFKNLQISSMSFSCSRHVVKVVFFQMKWKIVGKNFSRTPTSQNFFSNHPKSLNGMDSLNPSDFFSNGNCRWKKIVRTRWVGIWDIDFNEKKIIFTREWKWIWKKKFNFMLNSL